MSRDPLHEHLTRASLHILPFYVMRRTRKQERPYAQRFVGKIVVTRRRGWINTRVLTQFAYSGSISLPFPPFYSSLSLSSVWILHFSRLHPCVFSPSLSPSLPFFSIFLLLFFSPFISRSLCLSFSLTQSLCLRELDVHEDEDGRRCLPIDRARFRLSPEFSALF